MKKLIKDNEETHKKVYLCKKWKTKVGLPAVILRFEFTDEFWKILDLKSIKSGIFHDWWTGYVENVDKKEIDTDQIEVHGGVTFNGGYPLGTTAGEWIGFDLNHFDDTGEESIDYVIEQCERLAREINEA